MGSGVTRGTASTVPDPRLVLFDLDDTLCDYASARAIRLRRAFSLCGVGASRGEPLDGPDLDRMIADSIAMNPHGADHFPEVFRRHGVDEPAVAQRAMAWYRHNRFHALALFADALETVASVRAATGVGAGRRVGLVTNGPAETQRAKIALLGLSEVVDFALVSGEFGAWKPDPRIFAEALRLGEAAAEETVFVGDSPEHDVAGARRAGIRAVWINRRGQRWPGGMERADHEVADLAGVRRLLGGERPASLATEKALSERSCSTMSRFTAGPSGNEDR